MFSIALRRVGKRELAEEVAQNVFAALARKASSLRAQASLAGWLHRATMLESFKALRSEYRRQRKLEALIKMEAEDSRGEQEDYWNQVIPLLDEALLRLSSKERDLVLQHYFAFIDHDNNQTHYRCRARDCRCCHASLPAVD